MSATDFNDLGDPARIRRRVEWGMMVQPPDADLDRYVDNGRDAARLAAEQQPPRVIAPRGFAWRDPKTIPPRAFIMGPHFIRRYVSATIAPGGLGKSALLTAEALALVTGRALLGVAPRLPPETVAFPNVDLTVHLFREPRAGWLGFDTSVSFGAAGLGLTQSVLHDRDGAFGTVAQCLTVRPR